MYAICGVTLGIGDLEAMSGPDPKIQSSFGRTVIFHCEYAGDWDLRDAL